MPEKISLYVDGDGFGYGYGDDYGYGDGDDYGDGFGYGEGFGYGDGDGFGYGDGDDYGYGDGDAEILHSAIRTLFSPEHFPVNELKSGQLYMFAIGEGWMFVGRFVRPSGAFGGVFAETVNVARTGGTSWAGLAAGEGRAGATFVAYPPAEVPFPIVRFAFPWAGELPATTRR